jgi:hypothetical protein
VQGASVSQVAGYNTTLHTLTVIDAQDTVVQGITSVGSGAAGVLVTTSAGAATKRATIRGARIYNPGNAAGAIKEGVSIGAAEATSLTLDAGTVQLREWMNNDSNNSATLNFPAGWPVRTGSIGDRTRYACNALPTAGVYAQGDVVENTASAASATPGWVCVSGGGAYSSTWAAATAYTVGTQVKLSTNRTLLCVAAGTSGAAEPATPAALGQTVVDGGVTWQYTATSVVLFKARAVVAA